MLDLIFSDYRPYIQDVLAWGICCAALWWGGGPERVVAATWLILFELGTLLHSAVLGNVRQLESVDWFFASMDFIAGVILITAALYANRNYVLWIAAMQLLAMVAHLSRSLTEVITPVTYAVMVIAPGWLQLIFLAIGLARHVRRKREHGDYRDWRIRNQSSQFAQFVPRGEAPLRATVRSEQSTWRDELK